MPWHQCEFGIHSRFTCCTNCDLKISLPGVDVILDNIGGLYLQRNLNSLGVDGRLFIIGFQGGAAAEVNLQPVLARRLTIQGIFLSVA
jgi:NADPH:quinone reductase-like Zn-dependent oxidoreductase